ncbi:maleylacetoacetate isomerase [Polaromonas vacuolata]|nr:maleylacetoacetate isomerase [Polaromonas vacuolata]
MLILHTYWLSLATYRVRIALNLKGIAFEERAHDLSKGAHNSPEFRKLNPAAAVPALEGGTRQPLTQSLAILEWLEESYPTPPLLPPDAESRAKVRSFFLLNAADTHPLAVPRVQAKLAKQFGLDEAAQRAWAAHWYHVGLTAYESQIAPGATRCHGEVLSIADLALASHLIGAVRFGVDLTEFPNTAAVGECLFAIPEFAAAHPRLQLGAPGIESKAV